MPRPRTFNKSSYSSPHRSSTGSRLAPCPGWRTAKTYCVGAMLKRGRKSIRICRSAPNCESSKFSGVRSVYRPYMPATPPRSALAPRRADIRPEPVAFWQMPRLLLGPIFPTLIAILLRHVQSSLHGRVVGIFFCVGGIGWMAIPMLICAYAKRTSVQRSFLIAAACAALLTGLRVARHGSLPDR